MKIVFMGTPQAAVPTLAKILDDGHEVVAVWTQPDRPAGRGNRLNVPAVKEFALSKGLAVHQPLKIKTEESLELFKSHQADVAVVVAYGRILPEIYLQTFPSGAINVHFSLLPKYRGAAPVNWAIARGEIETGVTTMKMDAGLDTGAILLQEKTRIEEKETAPELMSRLAIVGANLLGKTLKNLSEIKPIEQDNERATFAPVMKKEDGLIDWNLTASEIANRVRGFQPFPSSFTIYQSKKLTLWSAEAATESGIENNFGKGEIIRADKNNLLVACGNQSVLNITELQLEGKKRLPARDFLNGIKIQTGEKFG